MRFTRRGETGRTARGPAVQLDDGASGPAAPLQGPAAAGVPADGDQQDRDQYRGRERLGDHPGGEGPHRRVPAVTVSVEGQPEPDRLAWAVAQWAVAGADRRDVVAVSVAGSTWRRDGDAGWVDDDGAAPQGGVVIEVGGR